MSSNSIGELFRVTTFGESHGKAVGCVIDGCPPNINLSEGDIQPDLDRRKPGQSYITSQRHEEDVVEIISGVFEGKTLGTPICMLVKNKDVNPRDYQYLKDKYRPSHADFTYQSKFGIRAWTGGGRASARETVARVMAGAVAKKILKQILNIKILAYVSQIGNIKSHLNVGEVKSHDIESNIVRCPDTKKAKEMINLITKTRKEGNSLGGIVTCIVKNVPVGFGDPVFDKLDADLAKSLLSIPATKGFEIGSGFAASTMTGLENNDPFCLDKNKKITTKTNNSGGIQGGISNGEDIIFKLAFKPTPTIMLVQESVNKAGQEIKLKNIKGRHDPCIVPRVIPVVEAMTSLTLLDHYLRHKAQNL